MEKFKGLTPGRVIHFVLPSGLHRPAIVTHIWNKETGMISCSVFPIESDNLPNIWLRTSVDYSETNEPYTWHWVEHVE